MKTRTRRLEIVHLRMPGEDTEPLVRQIRESVAAQPGVVELRIYRSVLASTDISVHLHVEAESDGVRSGELGLRLADALRTYGLVEHSVWRECEPSGRGRCAGASDDRSLARTRGHPEIFDDSDVSRAPSPARER